MRDPYPLERIERERRSIKESDDLSEEAREYLITFDQKIEDQCGYGDRFSRARHYTLLCNIRLLGERTNHLTGVIIEDVDSQDAAKEAGRELIRHIKREFTNGYTRDTKIGCVRVYIELVGNPNLIPDYAQVFKANFSGQEDSTPAPGTILRWDDDVVPMIRAANNWRDRALSTIQWASGCRPMSELHGLTYGQLVDEGDHFILTTPPESKTGERDVRVFVGVPYLRKWLRKHPAHNDGGLQADTPIWTRLNKNRHLSYGQYGKVFRTLADRAEVTKPTYPQHFRASRASILASREFVNQADLEVHFGWARGSSAAANYISRFSKETARHIAKADGVVVETDIPDDDSSRHAVSLDTENDGPIAPIMCPNCNQLSPRHRDTCLWCPTEITPDEAKESGVADVVRSEEATQAREDVVQMVTNGELAKEDIDAMRDVEEAVAEYPNLLEHLEELLVYLGHENDDAAEGMS